MKETQYILQNFLDTYYDGVNYNLDIAKNSKYDFELFLIPNWNFVEDIFQISVQVVEGTTNTIHNQKFDKFDSQDYYFKKNDKMYRFTFEKIEFEKKK